jgi:hypothetical protein
VWRGQRVRGPSARARPRDQPVWVSSPAGLKTEYRLNREHPAVKAALGQRPASSEVIAGLLSLIERTVPIERIWLDVSEAEGVSAPDLNPKEMTLLAEQLASIARSMSPEMSVAERVNQMVRHLPGDTNRLQLAVLTLLEGIT